MCTTAQSPRAQPDRKPSWPRAPCGCGTGWGTEGQDSPAAAPVTVTHLIKTRLSCIPTHYHTKYLSPNQALVLCDQKATSVLYQTMQTCPQLKYIRPALRVPSRPDTSHAVPAHSSAAAPAAVSYPALPTPQTTEQGTAGLTNTTHLPAGSSSL